MRPKFTGVSPEEYRLIEKFLEKEGVPMAGPDHWIYSEGPSTVFLTTSEEPSNRAPAKTKLKKAATSKAKKAP